MKSGGNSAISLLSPAMQNSSQSVEVRKINQRRSGDSQKSLQDKSRSKGKVFEANSKNVRNRRVQNELSSGFKSESCQSTSRSQKSKSKDKQSKKDEKQPLESRQ